MALPSAPDERLTNSLTAIADDLRRANDAAEQAERDAVVHALEAGRLLCEAKEHCQHGHWLPFLARAGVPERKAQRLMKLHGGRLKPDFVSDLGGVAPALTFLRYRELTMGFLDDAERAAIRFEETGEGHGDLMRPIECAIDGFAAMIAMLPAEIGKRT
jgi:hypothetical protein